ncbi:MAG: M48 family metalloprotease [Vulcanimicrobiaceae bacterium]
MLARRLGLALVLLLLGVAGVRAQPASAAPAFVDRRVSALPAGELLHRSAFALIDRRRQRIAEELRRFTRPLFLFWALAQIGLYVALWRTGAAARLRDALRRAVRAPFAMRWLYGASLVLLGALASLPAAFAQFRVEYDFDLTHEHTLQWAHDGLINAGLDALIVGTIVACVFWLVDRTRLWYLYTIGGLVAVTLLMAFLEPLVVAPLYTRYHALPQTAPLRASLERLARRAGVGEAPIEVADLSLRSTAIVADLSGFGPTKRIVLSDALLADATPREALFLAAREFGHYVVGDDFRLSLFWTLLFIVVTALSVVVADRIVFRRDDDALARLPLVFAFMGLGGLICAPLYNGYSRGLEARADAFALALTGDRVAAVRAFVRIADETLTPICPSPLSVFYFSNSPPLGSRIARAQGRPDPCRD